MKRVHANTSEETLEARKRYRDRIDLLADRISLLAGKDRLLMTMHLKNGNSFRQIAQLAGVNEVNIARRIHKLTKRLIDGEYITCLRNRDRFNAEEMAVAKDYFLTGLSMKKIAAKRHCSYYRVRETLKSIKRLISVRKK